MKLIAVTALAETGTLTAYPVSKTIYGLESSSCALLDSKLHLDRKWFNVETRLWVGTEHFQGQTELLLCSSFLLL